MLRVTLDICGKVIGSAVILNKGLHTGAYPIEAKHWQKCDDEDPAKCRLRAHLYRVTAMTAEGKEIQHIQVQHLREDGAIRLARKALVAIHDDLHKHWQKEEKNDKVKMDKAIKRTRKMLEKAGKI